MDSPNAWGLLSHLSFSLSVSRSFSAPSRSVCTRPPCSKKHPFVSDSGVALNSLGAGSGTLSVPAQGSASALGEFVLPCITSTHVISSPKQALSQSTTLLLGGITTSLIHFFLKESCYSGG